MKHDSISKNLMETSLSASSQTELFHFICGTNGEKNDFLIQFKKTAVLCRVCSLLGATDRFQCGANPHGGPEEVETVVSI